MARDRVRAEPLQPAEGRLGGAEGHEDLAHRRRVGRDPAADPVSRGVVRAVDLGEARDAGRRRDGDVRRLSRQLLEALEEGQRERRQIADRGVAARVVDEDRAGPKAAAGMPLGEAVPLERPQEPRRRRLRQLRLLHHPAEGDHVVALDEPDEDPRGAIDRLRTLLERGHRCHIVAPTYLVVNSNA